MLRESGLSFSFLMVLLFLQLIQHSDKSSQWLKGGITAETLWWFFFHIPTILIPLRAMWQITWIVCAYLVSTIHPNTSDKTKKKVTFQVGNGIGKGSNESMNTRSFSMRLKIKWRTEDIQREVRLLLRVTGITQEKGFACTISKERLE